MLTNYGEYVKIIVLFLGEEFKLKFAKKLAGFLSGAILSMFMFTGTASEPVKDFLEFIDRSYVERTSVCAYDYDYTQQYTECTTMPPETTQLITTPETIPVYNGLNYKVRWGQDGGYAEIVEYSSYNNSPYKGDIVIPSEIEGYPVKSISGYAFRKTSITSIEIPDSVTEIGGGAFYGCVSLKSVRLPEALTEMPSAYIYNYYNSSVYGGFFEGCSSLESIVIPNSVESLGAKCFYGCSSLKSITLPESITEIPSYTFEKHDDNGEVIGKETYGLFQGCTGLEAMEIPDSVTKIGERAFMGCSGLGFVKLPNGVTQIGNGAFSDCYKLESIIIPHSVTEIGENAFRGCKGLESAVLSENLMEISDGTFSGCTSLRNIVLPSSITKVGAYAFSDCSSLESMDLPDNLTSIGVGAFNGCYYFREINIPDSVVSIGDSAFYGCSNVQRLTLGKNVESIGASAFENTMRFNVKCLEIPDSVITIGNNAFKNTNIESVKMGNSVSVIGDSAFSECSALSEITLPESVQSIGKEAFYKCTSLEEISIENPQCEIYDSALTLRYTAVIYGAEGSTAEAYADKYIRTFMTLGSEIVFGDVNLDGKIDLQDLVCAAKYMADPDAYGLSDRAYKCADMIRDGQVTNADVVALIKLVSEN